MSELHLTLACEDYDRTRPLKDGVVKPEGIEVNYLVMSVEEIFWRMMKYEEFDASELSMGAFLTAAARGRRPFTAIPVFPSRTFRHRCIFVNTGSGVESVGDLKGRRMGVPEYSMTAAVWLRGMFEHEYGVKPSDIHWVQAGEEHPGRKDRVEFDMPLDTGDFRLISKRVLRLLNDMPEQHRFIRGMVSWVGFNQVAITYERQSRHAGETKYPLRKMLRFALDGITSFSVRPLRLASYLGMTFGALGIAVLGYTLIAWTMRWTVAGWTSIMTVVLLLGSAQLAVLGIIGEYLGRLCLEAKRRPLFVIDKIERKPFPSLPPDVD
jgi:hypothetical protein